MSFVRIRVLVATHIRLYCEGLERVLRESPEFSLVDRPDSGTGRAVGEH
jgi:hypothetical protein